MIDATETSHLLGVEGALAPERGHDDGGWYRRADAQRAAMIASARSRAPALGLGEGRAVQHGRTGSCSSITPVDGVDDVEKNDGRGKRRPPARSRR
ncbi:hypothetical protein [Humibacter ginsenosidimutans]|uniref:hypothetical protein n=1 Tax=Humibacter ginsenosidimutans TaxID=2599293 RepID=UPI001FEF1110|nr:hypothetical protein [Humibacter ginsenosidimutans]